HRPGGGFEHMPGRREIGLADAEIDDGLALGLQRKSTVEDGKCALFLDSGDIGIEVEHEIIPYADIPYPPQQRGRAEGEAHSDRWRPVSIITSHHQWRDRAGG